MKDKLYTYKARILRVVDGDTIDVLVDLGFDVFKKVRIRMLAYNAPEIWRASGEELEKGQKAKEYLQKQINELGSEVIIQSKTYDRYGRTLAYVLTQDGQVSFNKLLENYVRILEE